MKIKRLALLLFFSFGLLQVKGQNIYGEVATPDNSSITPTGQDIINVNPFTGIGTVNIPLSEYSVDGINCDVSLNYIAKGIKVDQVASPVGLGWSISAGGSVTRRVMGIEDEITTPAIFNVAPFNDHFSGYLVPGRTYGSYGTYNDDMERDVFHLNLCGRQLEATFYIVNNNVKVHTYPKSNIKVEVVTKDWDIVTNSYINIRSGVQVGTGLTEFDDIFTFNITDEKGNKFYFERGDYKYQHYSYDNADITTATKEGYYYVTTKWNLVRLETYSGQEVTYEFNTTDVDYVTSIKEVLMPNSETLDANNYIDYDPLEKTDIKFTGKKSLISKVNYPNGKIITFNSANTNTVGVASRCDCLGDFVLSSMTIEDKYDNNVSNKQEFVFDYEYFNTPGYGGLTTKELPYSTSCNSVTSTGSFSSISDKEKHWARGLRLKLKKIQKKVIDIGSGLAIYKDYYDFDYTDKALPYRFSPSTDYYGYYNGFASVPYKRDNPRYPVQDPNNPYIEVETSIPYQGTDRYPSLAVPSPFHILSYRWGANKTYDFNNAQAFALNKITNGLKGAINIEYTSYILPSVPSIKQYYYEVCTTSGGGCTTVYNVDTTRLEGVGTFDGLCIGKITFDNKYSTEHNSAIEYIYQDGEQFNTGGYTSYYHINTMWYYAYTNEFVGRDDFYQGANHGFSKVIKKELGYNNDVLSEKHFTFSNVLYDVNGTKMSNMHRRTGDDYRLCPSFLNKHNVGNLLKLEEYRKDNVTNSNTIVSKTEYDYETIDYTPANLNLNSTSITRIKGPNGLFEEPIEVIGSKINKVSKVTGTGNKTSLSGIASSSISIITNEYDSETNIKYTEYTDSRGEKYRKYYLYNYDFYQKYSWGTIPVLSAMNTNSEQHLLSTSLWKMTGPLETNRELLNLSIISPTYINGKLRFPSKYATNLNEPLLHFYVWPTSVPSTRTDFGNAISNITNAGTNLVKVNEVTVYGTNNIVLENRIENSDLYNSAIVDYKRGVAIADAYNAKYEDIAFTSFEIEEVDNDGNWNFDWTKRQYAPTGAMTGKYIYELNYGAANNIESNTLNAQKYILSFWVKTTNASPTIQLVDFNNTITSSLLPSIQNSVGDWDLYTVEISPSPHDNIRISNTDASSEIYIDEIRLHPRGASMTTYTYEPLYGISSTSDNSNYIIYNVYDLYGSLYKVLDMYGNIRKKIEVVSDGPESGANTQGGSSGGGSGS